MDIDVALKLVDATAMARAARHLSAPEERILQGTWQGMTYEQMADTSEYSTNYLMRDIGPKLWKLLSEALGEEVSKTNFRVVLERRFPEPLSEIQRHQEAVLFDPGRHRNLKESQPCSDLVEAPDISGFLGRTAELATLKQWIVEQGCRLVVLRGMRGIGKTVLCKKLVELIQEDFDYVIWRSLTQAPPLTELLGKLLTSWRNSRCLIVLDGADAILQNDQLSGRYREGYKHYGEFFRRMGEESHDSCVIITSRENPREVTLLSGETTPVRSFILSGLKEDEAQEILETEGLIGQERWSELITLYRGHPSALKMVAKIIRELFHGNVAEFLEQETLVFGEIDELLGQSFNRLSDLEKEVLYWLAIENKPVDFSTLQTSLNLSLSQAELLEILASLRQRSLLETTEAGAKSYFALQPMMMEYITNQLVAQISGNVSTAESPHYPLPEIEESIELTPSTKLPVNLSQWFDNNIETGWQPVEVLLGAKPQKSSPRLRSTYHLRQEGLVKRFKPIQIGKRFQNQVVALLVAIAAEADQKVGIRVQVQPMGEETSLPANLKLGLLNESGQILREVQSQTQDNFIQLPRFRGERTEHFTIQVAFDAFSMTEEFVI
ncbi:MULTISPECIES: DUF1822 family protein [unclassified Coleofasciculus]|uniref:DUF1822 family protein n=1 Tax=unclassified Coleofasciculus TaxID=2692782 RepID=UPI00187FC7C4|nr:MULTISPECIES: DUF1822 family protein [unclassified Coleofasciculus]MBE9124709.1 DUF1822 family protein [Coleofasciculus sp. LEGE 07081]MBE9147036.1 DUF1822 family protein [Coleofasciculus sp. LEGE 07092]